jgi:6-phosphogluconolactonase
MKLRVFASRDELFEGAAEEFAKGLFTLLASGVFPAVPWDKIFLFWGDERHVPPDTAASNYRMTKEALLSKVAIPEANIFRIKTENPDAEKVARDYEQTLKKFFNLKPEEFPRFDLTMNGIGPEGHTASLFPGSPALEETTRLVAAPWIEKFNMYRITLTLPVFNSAACVLFLAAGQEKISILKETFENPSLDLPAQRINPTNGELLWFLDSAAASGLKKTA